MTHKRRRRLRDTLTAYLFISPSALVIGAFGIFPFFFTVYVSVHRWRLARVGFSGLDNYLSLFGHDLLPLGVVAVSIAGVVGAGALFRRAGVGMAGLRSVGIVLLLASVGAFMVFLPALASQGDKAVFDSLRVTIWYSVCTVPVQIAGGLLLALLLMRRMRGKQAFRVMYLMPYIAPTVATAAVFELLFSLRPDSFANQVLHVLGAPPLQWLQEPRGVFSLLFGNGVSSAGAGITTTNAVASAISVYWGSGSSGPSLALMSIVFYSWWVFVGYYALIYMNGLAAIPRHLYEAAEVDGAGRVRTFFSITLPLLSPTTSFLTLLGVIGTFRAFTHLFVLRSAAAAETVDPLAVSIFFTAFRKGNMGYASAVAIVLFLIVLGLTILQQRTTERSITYGD